MHSLGEYCQKTGLKVNQDKTQLLAISSNKKSIRVWLQAGKTQIESSKELKLLGFLFSDNPDVSAQISNLITRAAKRLFVLRYYSTFMPGNDLKKLYCALVRSVIEYSSVTYHSMLSKKQENDLEMLQKKCLRCIYGYNKSYDELLKESGLEPLKTRRERAFLKFAKNSANNPIYAHWFKLNPNQTSQRCPKIYEERFARTSRLYNSPLFSMRRILNNTPDDDNAPVRQNFMDLAHLFDDL